MPSRFVVYVPLCSSYSKRAGSKFAKACVGDLIRPLAWSFRNQHWTEPQYLKKEDKP